MILVVPIVQDYLPECTTSVGGRGMVVANSLALCHQIALLNDTRGGVTQRDNLERIANFTADVIARKRLADKIFGE
jgi:hypothetical protein